MTDNMKRLIDQITTAVNSECGDDLPTLEYINRKAEQYRTIFASLYPISDGEFEKNWQRIFCIKSALLQRYEDMMPNISLGILYKKMMVTIGTDIKHIC